MQTNAGPSSVLALVSSRGFEGVDALSGEARLLRRKRTLFREHCSRGSGYSWLCQLQIPRDFRDAADFHAVLRELAADTRDPLDMSERFGSDRDETAIQKKH